MENRSIFDSIRHHPFHAMHPTIDYRDPYALITSACETLLGRLPLTTQTTNPLLYIWRMGRHLTEFMGIESTVSSAAQMVGLFEDVETKDTYRGFIRDAVNPLSDWHLVFLIHRFMVLIASSDSIRLAEWENERNAWCRELLDTYQKALSERKIDLCTFVHMLQLPVQPSLQRIPDTMLTFSLAGLFPDVSSPKDDIAAMAFQPLWERVSQDALNMLHVGMEFEQSFSVAWTAVMVARGAGGKSDGGGLLDVDA